MDGEIFIPISFFALIFGILYMYFSTRHKERSMLIEKGVDASIFHADHQKSSNTWKILVLNVALLMMGIGLGMFLSIIFQDVLGVSNDAIQPACIFLMAGVGLLTGYFMTKRI